MTNFRRALLALITFITGVGLSLGVTSGTASAWHTNSSCVNYTWVITYPNEDWSNGPANFNYDVGTDDAGVLPGQSRTAPAGATSASITWANSQDTDTETRPRGCTRPEKPADGYTDRTVDGTCTVGQNTVDVKVYRTPFTWVYNVQTNTWDKVVGAEFLFSTTPRNLTEAEQITCKPARGYEDRRESADCSAGDNTVTVTVYRTLFWFEYINGVWTKVYGPETVLSTSERPLNEAEQEKCAPSYRPEVKVVETSCETGDTQITITTTTTTYHAEYIDGVWVKVANEPTVEVTYRPLNEREQNRCKPADESITRRVSEDCTTGANTVTVTLYQTNFTWVYGEGGWVKVQDGDEFVVTTAERPLNEAEQKECQPADEYTTRRVSDECTVGSNTVTVTLYRTDFTWVYEDGEWVKIQDGPEYVIDTGERPLNEDEQAQCQPADEYTTRADNGECSVGDNTVTVTEYRTNFTWAYVDGEWVKSQDGDEFVTGTHERTLSADEIITCVPTREKNVVVDNGVAKCGDTTVATTTTTTTYTYTYENGIWVEHSNVVVVHGSRSVTTEPCPTTTTTVVPPTTVSIAPDVPLPKTGGGLSGLGIGGLLFGVGTLLTVAAMRRRKVRNA